MKTLSVVSTIAPEFSVNRMYASGDILVLTVTDRSNTNLLLFAPMPEEPTGSSPLTMVPTPDFLRVVDVRSNHVLLHLRATGDEQNLKGQACVVNVESAEIKNFGFPKTANPVRLSDDGKSIFLLVPCSGKFSAYSGGPNSSAFLACQSQRIFEVWRLGEQSLLGVVFTFYNVGSRVIEQTAVYDDFLAIATSDGVLPGVNEVSLVRFREDLTGDEDYETLPRFEANQIFLEGAGRTGAYGSVVTAEGRVAAKFGIPMAMIMGGRGAHRVVADSPNGTITILESENNGQVSILFYLGLSSHPIKDFITSWPPANVLPASGTLLLGPAAIGPLNELFMIARSGANHYLVRVF